VSILNVNGIVSHRDKQPYIRLFQDDKQIAQLSMAEARNFAKDIEIMASRTEADAMILKFFESEKIPMEVAAMLMQQFRDFRFKLDMQPVGKVISDPDAKPDKM